MDEASRQRLGHWKRVLEKRRDDFTATVKARRVSAQARAEEE